jgi:hypothetical protein
LAIAMSESRSPLKSATATAPARPPPALGEFGSAAKPPPGPRSRTLALPDTKFATATSGRPSPLKSPTPAKFGPVPVGNGEPLS